jgi:hypothetical protein
MTSLTNWFRGSGTRKSLWYGASVLVVCLLVTALPLFVRLQRRRNALASVRRTYHAKVVLASRTDWLARRLAEQEAIVADFAERRLTDEDRSALTREITAAARAARCTVEYTRLPEPRVLPNPREQTSAKKGIAVRAKVSKQFMEWPVRVTVSGEYRQIMVLLATLARSERHMRLARVAIQPRGDERERVSCELEISGYGIRHNGKEG